MENKYAEIIHFEDIWEIFTSVTQHPSDVDEQKMFDKADGKVFILITLNISKEVQPHVQDAKTSKSTRVALSTIF